MSELPAALRRFALCQHDILHNDCTTCLRADVERLTRERDEARRERDEARGERDWHRENGERLASIAKRANDDLENIDIVLGVPDGTSLLEHAGAVVKALREACDYIDSGSAFCSDCDRGGNADEWRALLPAVRR